MRCHLRLQRSRRYAGDQFSRNTISFWARLHET
jgi:hypothetical protein